MQLFKTFALLILASLIGGCSLLQGGKLLTPESFGLHPIAPNLYVENGMSEAAQDQLRAAMSQAEAAVKSAYGNVLSRPTVNACISEACYESFGGHGSVAKVYGNRILLSPRGLNWHYLAHEWSHAELRTRLTLGAWWHIPQWFDEGLAVAVSDAPEHSEAHWQFLANARIPCPSSEELYSFQSLKQWNEAVGRFGEKMNEARRTKGEPEIHPVYAAAGHEVRSWLAQVGTDGLLAVIQQLDRGELFIPAYLASNFQVETQAASRAVGPRSAL